MARIEELIAPGDPDSDAAGGGSFLQELKADPGQPGLETLLGEIAKLEWVRAIGLPASLFTDAPEKLVIAWRSRAARMYPSDFAKAPDAVKLTLLAALCHVRLAELTDGLAGPADRAGCTGSACGLSGRSRTSSAASSGGCTASTFCALDTRVTCWCAA